MLSFKCLSFGNTSTRGESPFAKWVRALNAHAAAKVATALERIPDGNLSNVKPIGSGVLEYRIDFGPGYRIYFGRDGDRLVILLVGATKKRQEDIRKAIGHWDYYRSGRLREPHYGTNQGFS
jgi:putative addiction module killer protein